MVCIYCWPRLTDALVGGFTQPALRILSRTGAQPACPCLRLKSATLRPKTTNKRHRAPKRALRQHCAQHLGHGDRHLTSRPAVEPAGDPRDKIRPDPDQTVGCHGDRSSRRPFGRETGQSDGRADIFQQRVRLRPDPCRCLLINIILYYCHLRRIMEADFCGEVLFVLTRNLNRRPAAA